MNEIRVLIVEDDDNQQKLYDKAIREFNSTHRQENIYSDFKKTLEEAMKSLEIGLYDAAIIDLKLRNDSVQAEGNEIIRKIKDSQRYPVLVVSGFVGKLDPEFGKETDVFKIIGRNECDTASILTTIYEWYSSGITRFGEMLTTVTQTLHEIFWTDIAKNWNAWKEDAGDIERLEKIIKRYLTSILVGRLRLNADAAGFEKMHPAEVYFIPPLKQKQDYFTGDILEKDGKYYLILSPACDMVVRENKEENKKMRNAEIILTCSLIPLNQKDEFDRLAFKGSSGEKVKKIIENEKNRYHFLPPYEELTGFVIDFQDVNQIPVSELNLYNRKAEITDFFLSNIITRFSAYYSRQGQPEFDSDMIIAKIKANLEKKNE